MTKAFCVAGHTFHLELPDGSPLWPLLTQYDGFVTEPVENPLFVLSAVENLPETDKAPLYVAEPEDEGQPRLDLYSCKEGCLVEMAPLASLPPCAKMLMSPDYSKGSLQFLKRSQSSAVFAVNNSLMLMFAFRSAPYKTLEMHASVIMNGGKGYLFLGRSGTGKSTHSSLWLKYIEGSELMNDDNPVIRVCEDGVTRVFGSPWSGKTPCYRNVDLPAGGFVQLAQAPYNAIRRLRGISAYASLLTSISGKRWDRSLADGLHETENALAAQVPVWHLDCLPDAAAAQLCRDVITQEES